MKVFISHAASDQAVAQDIAKRLRSEGLDVWEDDDIVPGDNWARKIGDALAAADVLVVLVSPDSVKSPSVRREIDYALGSKRLQNRLLPVLVRSTDEIPWILEKLQLVRIDDDVRRGSERVVLKLKQLVASA